MTLLWEKCVAPVQLQIVKALGVWFALWGFLIAAVPVSFLQKPYQAEALFTAVNQYFVSSHAA
ncbi:MAG: hypothetical protein GY796_36060 [Chloroflexi bacterium]|nr:hypothetical protein [Chloroflexota bacterium]